MEQILATAHIGNRIWFAEEKRPYTIRAQNERYLICTKPFAPKKTVIYSIVDLDEKVRGTDSLIFGLGYETEDCIAQNMALLASGEMEVSHRNRIPLDVVRMAA